jgi:hypothetical protein
MVEPIETLEGGSGGIPVVSHQTAYYIPILLLHVAAIVLLVGTRPGKGNALLVTVGVEASVDEFAAIVRIHTEESERKSLPHPVYCRSYSYLTFTPNRNTFRPATGDIHSAEGSQIKTFSALTTVSHQVHL